MTNYESQKARHSVIRHLYRHLSRGNEASHSFFCAGIASAVRAVATVGRD
jgi:hypothetical protein